MKKLTLNEAAEETKKVVSKMPDKNWTIHNRFTELVEEVGELANAIQTDEGFKTQKRKKSEVIDSICDVLFEIFNIANHYKVDLDKEYPQILKQLKERTKKGEFNH